MISKIQATEVFEKTLDAGDTRIIINEGSSRSSKTYSICQIFFTKMCKETGKVFTIVRKTLPALKATAYKDFIDVLQKSGAYNQSHHNKSDLTYTFHGNEIEFISVDDYKKVKGRKRDYLFCNEANELSYDEFTQLAIRTTKQIYLDYNPSHDQFHWIEEKIKTRDDVVVIHSTYKDNPFNSKEVIKEIERLKDTDPNLWRVYGLGLMGLAMSRIFNHFQLCDEMPENYTEKFYGLDFGYNHPTALVEIREVDDAYYVDEIIYQTGWVNSVLMENMESLKIDKDKYMFADNEDKNRIQEIKAKGYNIKLSNKDVKKGIDTVKSKKIFITKRSINIQKESRGYSYKTTADGRILDEPVKINDDALCALRYGIHTYIDEKNKEPNIRIL